MLRFDRRLTDLVERVDRLADIVGGEPIRPAAKPRSSRPRASSKAKSG